MDTYYEHRLSIDSRDVDGLGRCRASALLGHMQEAATQAAETGGFGREIVTEKYNGFWMLTRVWFLLSRPLMWGEDLTIRTWHRGAKRASMYRDYDLYVNGLPVGEGVSVWVLADRDTRRLVRLDRIGEFEGTDGGSLCKSVLLQKLRCPEELTESGKRILYYSDTDINGHVNNTRYADFACDAVRQDMLPPERFLSRMQIGYLAECRPGEILTLEAGEQEQGKYVRGVDKNGSPRFESELIFSQVIS